MLLSSWRRSALHFHLPCAGAIPTDANVALRHCRHASGRPCQVTQSVLSRGPKLCNFLEMGDMKVVYKRYASLYFCAGVDSTDNELYTLEVIHHFVEILDRCASHVVCALSHEAEEPSLAASLQLLGVLRQDPRVVHTAGIPPRCDGDVAQGPRGVHGSPLRGAAALVTRLELW